MAGAADDDDDDGDDFAFFALVTAGAYFFWQLYRYRLAAQAGGGVFETAAPAQGDPTSGILNILVPLQLSPTGAAFIKQQEGFSATPYADGGKTSIGYGHQIQPGENIPQPISRADGEQLFASDAAKAAQTVGDAVKVELSQSQFDALVDFVFNIGRGDFLKSHLLAYLNSGDYARAAAEFSRWVHSGGQVNADLVARRALDQQLFNGG
jgi:lysozyme